VTLIETARERWECGVLEHRRGAESFQGDPLVEARAEVADLWNYVGECRRQSLIGAARCMALRVVTRAAWRLLS
jgi:hypothetical protein